MNYPLHIAQNCGLMNPSYINFILLARSAKDSTSFDPSMLYLILALVGMFVLVLLLVFTRARLFPLIKLGYITLVHGRYSFDFIEFFKENNLRNPHNNCIKDEISMHFYVFYRPRKESLFFKTESAIEFGDTPFFSLYKELIRKKGEPECINISRFKNARVRLVGFTETIQLMRMKSFFYFVEDRLIMGEYYFSDVNKIKTEDIITSLTLKYLNGNNQITSDHFFVTDPNGNKLNYENNGFAITIRYFYRGDEETNRLLDSVFGNNETNNDSLKLTMRQEELLNRF